MPFIAVALTTVRYPLLSLFLLRSIRKVDKPIGRFGIPIWWYLLLGFVFHFVSHGHTDEVVIQKREAYLSVALSWSIVSLFGCLPYLFSGAIPSFVDALFESVSGFTTTGSSVLTDVEALPKSILFWRSLTHWIGGIGIIVLVIIVMPSLSMGGYQLFSLESSLQEKIRPRIKSVGRRLLLIYISLTFLEVVFLRLGGMNFFDGFCHAFGTIATGGFSTKNDSLVSYSPYIQYVVMVFMLMAGTNFGVFLLFFHPPVPRNQEK
ncbi:MAG: TrkH family potassium uptake protein [Saprospiraceae bacterium]|nr:TrkH family potassium uptake protein [Saprospiraceae bacterium]